MWQQDYRKKMKIKGKEYDLQKSLQVLRCDKCGKSIGRANTIPSIVICWLCNTEYTFGNEYTKKIMDELEI
jgi:hypothetical protein